MHSICFGRNTSLGSASILSSCKQQPVVDEDMLSKINRTVRGIEVTDELLSKETIRQVVYGEGNFLGAPQTLEWMQSEYIYREVSNRQSTKEWDAAGKPDPLADLGIGWHKPALAVS
ncbi:MAG: trimethylamine methyltransferase family protein [Pseudomonadota bacterium]